MSGKVKALRVCCKLGSEALFTVRFGYESNLYPTVTQISNQRGQIKLPYESNQMNNSVKIKYFIKYVINHFNSYNNDQKQMIINFLLFSCQICR